MDRWLLSLMGALAIGITHGAEHTSSTVSRRKPPSATAPISSASNWGRRVRHGGTSPSGPCWCRRARSYRRLAGPLLIVTVIALILVLIPGIGVVRGGAHRWLGVSPFVFQPSELAKVTFVLYLAYSLSRRSDRLESFLSGVLPPLVVSGVIVALLLAEPDFGSAFILVIITLAMLFVAGSQVKHLACVALAALPAAAFFIMSADYRVKRMLAFLDPWSDSANSGFQIIQSYIAFGSGQLWGRGLGQSRQKLLYLPEAHTDFIYSVIGEELGLWGALLVVGLFGVLLGSAQCGCALESARTPLRSVDGVRRSPCSWDFRRWST